MSVPTGMSITYTAEANTSGYTSGDHTFAWSFDDGTSATGASNGKAWSTPGIHSAAVTATNPHTLGQASASKTVEVFDNSWAPSLACPYRMYAPSYAVLANGNLLTCGDLSAGGTGFDHAWECDGSQWIDRGAIPRPRYNENSNKAYKHQILDDGRVIVVGGRTTGGIWSYNCDFYDPTSHTWSAGPRTTLDHRYLSNAHKLSDGRIIVLGDVGSDLGMPEFFNQATETWSLGTDAPYQIASGCAIPLDNDKFLVTSTAYTSRIVVYDAVADSWGTYTTLPAGVVHNPCVGLQVGTKVYVFGLIGADGKAVIYDIPTNTCTLGSNAYSAGTHNMCGLAVANNGLIFLDHIPDPAGGYASVFYNPASDTFSLPAKLSGTGSGIAFGNLYYYSATIAGRPFVFGSYDDSTAPYQVATIYSGRMV